MSKFKLGDRVVPSAVGVRNHVFSTRSWRGRPAEAEVFIATVIGSYNIGEGLVRVKPDTRKKPETYHESFLELAHDQTAAHERHFC